MAAILAEAGALQRDAVSSAAGSDKIDEPDVIREPASATMMRGRHTPGRHQETP
jgi:hypothetical protein